MTAKEQLASIFGKSFEQQENITEVRRYYSNNTFCLDGNGDIVAIFSSENDYEHIHLPAHLSKLQYLNLSDNSQLKKLTFESAMPALEHLDVSDSAIERIKLLDGFRSLKWLDLSRNQLKEFIPQGSLPALCYLDLSGNQLKDFSTSLLGKFPHLEELYLNDNENFPSTKNVSINKPGSCLAFMKRYARELAKGSTINKEYKVLLVGNGGVGKTCLVERMVYDSFEQKHLSTHGIALEQYRDEENNLTFPFILNLWDFGGQDIYHATHRLFMQSNAIYLALWDENTLANEYSEVQEDGQARPYENYSLQYWLHYIRHQGGNSPIIVVKTKSAKNNRFHPQQQQIQEKYGVSDFHQIDSGLEDWTENGFDRLTFFIKESIKKLGQKQELPEHWASLRQHLRELQKNGQQVLSTEEYMDIAEDYGIEAPMEVLTDWLVNSGVVFYRKGYFGSTIILDQQWAIKAIYTIFKRTDGSPYYRIKNEQQGRFSGRDLKLFWAKEAFSEAEQQLLVEFMLGCELCFEQTKMDKEKRHVAFEERQFFAPQMMPDQEPTVVSMFFDMTDSNELLYVKYRHSFLHYGIIQSFIVRTQDLADVTGIWRYGIVLKEEHRYAIVKEIDKEIHVITTASNKLMLDKIRNTLEDLQQSKVEEWVSRDGVEYVSMDDLKGWKHAQIPSENKKMLNTKDFEIFSQQTRQEKYELPKTGAKEEQLIQQMEKEKIASKVVLPDNGEVSLEPLPATILFLQANPTERYQSWEKEYTFIDKKIARARQDGTINLAKIEAASLDDMLDAIEDHEPQMLHFCGHGEEEQLNQKGHMAQIGGLVFHNEAKNKAEVVSAEVLEVKFKALKATFENLKIVLLSACHSQDQAAAISKAGIFAIGTSDEIVLEDAKKFAGGFYRGLVKTNNIITAIQRGITRATRPGEDIRKLVHLFFDGQKINLKK